MLSGTYYADNYARIIGRSLLNGGRLAQSLPKCSYWSPCSNVIEADTLYVVAIVVLLPNLMVKFVLAKMCDKNQSKCDL